MKRSLCTALYAATIWIGSVSARGTLITISPTAPVVDNADIAMLTQTGSSGHDLLFSDRPAAGQSFLTGSESGGYQLDAVTVQFAGGFPGTKTFTLRLGTIVGTSFAPIVSESGSHSDPVASLNFVTFTLNTPLDLLPNTLYGFDLGMTGSTTGWQQGIPNLNRNANALYASGSGYSSGSNGNGGATINPHAEDQVFHLNLSTVPEPTSASLVGLGLALVLRRIQRR